MGETNATRSSSSYLQLVGATSPLLLDARQHVFLHLIQDAVEGVELGLQVLLDPVGVCLVPQDIVIKQGGGGAPTLTHLRVRQRRTSRFSRLCFSVQTKFDISSFFRARVWVILRRDSCRETEKGGRIWKILDWHHILTKIMSQTWVFQGVLISVCVCVRTFAVQIGT